MYTGQEEETLPALLDPYVILRLLAENPDNLREDVIWDFYDVVEGGWAQESSFTDNLQTKVLPKYLIVTEGSSDTKILQASLPLVASDIADFFQFVDMEKNYPFTGTGNIVNFFKGLGRLGVSNSILFVLDNDAAGVEAYQEMAGIERPDGLQVVLLPKLECAKNVVTYGPTENSTADVNGSAVSIEFFLDFDSVQNFPPRVRWTSYNKRLERYQGELIGKEEYSKAFFKATRNNEAYNLDKLTALWSFLEKRCANFSTSS